MWPPAFEDPIQHKSVFAEIRETDGKMLNYLTVFTFNKWISKGPFKSYVTFQVG